MWRLPIARWPHGCVWWAVVVWVSLLPLSTRFCVRTSGVRLLTGEERERERVLSVTWLRPCGVRVVKQLGLSVVAWSSLVGSPGVVVVALVVWRGIVTGVCVLEKDCE